VKIRTFHWKSLSSEITLVYASLSVTLVVLLSYIAYQMNSRVLEERIEQDLLLTVDQTLRGINSEIEERAREVQTLSMTPALRHAAARGTAATETLGLEEAAEEDLVRRRGERDRLAQPGEVSAFLAEMKEGHPYIAEVFVTDRHGIVAGASNPTSDIRQDDEAWWHEAVLEKFYLSNLQYDESAGSYSYSIAMPILDEPRPPLGVVKGVFNLKAVQELVNSVQLGQRGYLVVISRDGRVLSHPDPQYLFRQIGDVPDLVPVAGILAASTRGVADYTPSGAARKDGQWMIGYSRLMRPASLGPLNWTVAGMVSRAEMIAPIITVRDSAVAAGFVFIIAAVPIVFAVSRRLSKPLMDLAHRADRISQGDLDVSLSMPAGDSANEIGRLASALAAMMDNLKAAHRRTLDINAGLERTVRERTEELQRKNRQIEAQNKKVMEASRLKSQFLANMSHELRTPLNAVLALSDIMANEMSGPLNEEQVKQVSIINRSGKSLLRLINDVLDLSKIEAGRMNVEKAPMSLHSLITLMVDTLRPLAEDKSLSVGSSMAPGLPEFITSDEHKLRQILINLMGNGIKFTERGGVRLDVGFTSRPAMISFVITDTGIGIAADAMDRIFDEFCQADGSTTRKYGGTGLGLTISKKMAELMGGTLSVESTPEKGSIFTLTVPYEPAPPVPASPTETLRRVRMQVPEPSLMSTGDDSATALHDARPIVLVAEDEHDNLYIMKKYLNRLGCQAVFARDGNEVLEKARKYKPIAITLDLVLPKKNGWDVLSELKTDSQTRHIPVIIASVLDNQERGFCLGAYRYLVKPINETDLADTILQIQAAGRKDVKRVLVVDDNVVDSDLMARLLVENKYDVLRAARGEEGIATAAREKPDLILLDLSMPGMDGFQVMQGLKRRVETRGIPVVIYTAKDLSTAERARLQRDAQKVFLKNPLDPVGMMSAIGELVKGLPGGAAEDARPVPGLDENDPWPRTAEAVTAAAVAAAATLAPSRRKPARKILLVEDDPANQYTIEYLLKNEGYEVRIAENGREGIEKAESWRPDLILMDMMMPVMGGHEATRELKVASEVKEIPVIALTAAAMTGDREKALAAGCDDYVSKPINHEHLFRRIDHWLARAAEARESGTPLKSLTAPAVGGDPPAGGPDTTDPEA
jgi:CheY-like chemotaxis protein/HAMP domain-containing protein